MGPDGYLGHTSIRTPDENFGDHYKTLKNRQKLPWFAFLPCGILRTFNVYVYISTELNCKLCVQDFDMTGLLYLIFEDIFPLVIKAIMRVCGASKEAQDYRKSFGDLKIMLYGRGRV